MDEPNTPLGPTPKTTNFEYICFPHNPLRQIIEVILGVVFLVGAFYILSLLIMPSGQQTPARLEVLFLIFVGMIIIGLSLLNVAYARSCGRITWATLWTMKGMPFLLLAIGIQFLWRVTFGQQKN